jgi:hypothetical protein
MPPRQWEGKQQVAHKIDEEEEMEFQNTKRAIKVIYGHSESSDKEHHKQLHVMYGGSWDIMSIGTHKSSISCANMSSKYIK